MTIVREVMTTSCASLTLLDNVYEAAVMMKEHNIGFVPVVDQGLVVGVVTDRDIVIRGVAGKRPNSARIRDVMTEAIIAVGPDTSIEAAAALMSDKQIRRLLVTNNGRLEGIVALGDLAVRTPLVNEAGHALSEISESSYTH
ncbi:CBS domain-containing protein [Paenibacillus arenosi]|uniref:CBS domain-containing protein n=1 Tax=Paenibacillus arenosi TaxID=2774142 RepID=A0ABR9AT33_9BACL|nr:CBS domain-containing protein [Paenibacillus arenosi]MBD8496849.1 CBS domain-containing protein [Paenibacillus arenosi]